MWKTNPLRSSGFARTGSPCPGGDEAFKAGAASFVWILFSSPVDAITE